MKKIIDKYRKQILAVVMSILMVVFIINLSPQQGQQNALYLRQVGTLNGTKVTQQQLNIANQEWQILHSMRFVSPTNPDTEPQPLLLVIFGHDAVGNEIAGQIEKSQKSNPNVPLFFLLVEEAKKR